MRSIITFLGCISEPAHFLRSQVSTPLADGAAKHIPHAEGLPVEKQFPYSRPNCINSLSPHILTWLPLFQRPPLNIWQECQQFRHLMKPGERIVTHKAPLTFTADLPDSPQPARCPGGNADSSLLASVNYARKKW